MLVKEQELETLRRQLSAKGGEVCAHDTLACLKETCIDMYKWTTTSKHLSLET